MNKKLLIILFLVTLTLMSGCSSQMPISSMPTSSPSATSTTSPAQQSSESPKPGELSIRGLENSFSELLYQKYGIEKSDLKSFEMYLSEDTEKQERFQFLTDACQISIGEAVYYEMADRTEILLFRYAAHGNNNLAQKAEHAANTYAKELGQKAAVYLKDGVGLIAIGQDNPQQFADLIIQSTNETSLS